MSISVNKFNGGREALLLNTVMMIEEKTCDVVVVL